MNSNQSADSAGVDSNDEVVVAERHSGSNSSGESRDLASDDSAELLRLTIPKITKHGNDFSHVSYGIWYEYVRGENIALREAIDECLKSTTRLSAQETSDLYRRFVVEALESALHASRQDLLQLLSTVDTSFDSANLSTKQFSESLENSAQRISNNPSTEQVKATIDDLLVESNGAREIIDSLNQQIKVSRTETERLSLELAQAKQNAETDPLSGLLNRRGFDKAMKTMIEQATYSTNPKEKTLSVLIIDIDHFKKANDTHGHLFGDKVIRTISRIFDIGVMRKDYVARIGGEEFAVLLPQTDETGGIVMANRIREAVQNTVIEIDHPRSAPDNSSLEAGASPQTYQVTISGGVAQYRHGEDSIEFIGRADKALYRAKQSGRNQVLKAGS